MASSYILKTATSLHLNCCPLCRTQLQYDSRQWSVADSLTYIRCQSCLAYIRKLDQLKLSFLQNQQDYYDNTEEDPFLQPSSLIKSRHSTLLRKIRPYLFGNTSIIEIGPGSGEFALALLRRFPLLRYLGCEISRPLYQRLTNHSLPAINSDFNELSTTYSADLILSLHTIEHIPDPYLQIQHAFRLLKPGGRFILATPNACSAEQFIAQSLSPNFDFAHLYVLSSKSILTMSKQAGFTVDSISTVSYLTDWLRILTSLLRRLKSLYGKTYSPGSFSRQASSKGINNFLALLDFLTAPLRAMQSTLKLGNEIFIVLRKPR